MAFYRGQQGAIYFDKDSDSGESELAAVRSWSASITKEALPTDAHGDASHSFIGGMIGGTGSCEVFYDAPGSGDKLDFLKEVVVSNDAANAAVELYLDEAGGKKITGNVLVTGADYGANVGDIETVTVNFTFNGEITLAV
tara:strand:+ start:457 stop:876 length:420 start_codon:yes stop_codon:yes gene_type:complete